MRTFKAFNTRRGPSDNLIIVYGSTPRSAARGVALQAQVMRMRLGTITVQEGELEGEAFFFRIGPKESGDRHWKVSPDEIDTLPECSVRPASDAMALLN